MTLSERVLAASAGRDRVSDAVKALALAMVLVAHSVAWTKMPDGKITNTLEAAPKLYPITWILQILPLFFLLAGSGLRSLNANSSGTRYLARVNRLLTPTAILILITLMLSFALAPLNNKTVSDAAGLLPVQLTWFLGVYLCLVALAPVLKTVAASLPLMVVWLVAICVVDVMRIYVSETVGWLNLILVWGFFAIIGLRLESVRQLSRPILLGSLIGSIAASVVAIWMGPYSPALISTTSVEGISNLAPPTIVLTFAGTAQICLLLLLWPSLERLMHKDKRWVPIAIFATRAMQLYLYHMVFLALGIALMLQFGGTPTPLGIMWWAEHILVAAVAITAAWLMAPSFSKGSTWIVETLSRLWPAGVVRLIAWIPRQWAQGLALLGGLMLFIVSDSGIGEPLRIRYVLGVPEIPIVIVIVIFAIMTVASVGSREIVHTS